MTDLSATFGEVPAAVAYLVLAAALLAESILLIGVFVPTLTLMLTAGALARTGHLQLPLVIAVSAAAVVIGDYLSYRTGRVLGARLRAGGVGRRIPDTTWLRAEQLMDRRGGQAIVVARFIPVIRTLVPHLAGAARLPYRRIAPYSAGVAPLWATAEAGSGYAAASSLHYIVVVGFPAATVLFVVITGVALWLRTRRKPETGRVPGRGRLSGSLSITWWARGRERSRTAGSLGGCVTGSRPGTIAGDGTVAIGWQPIDRNAELHESRRGRTPECWSLPDRPAT